MDRKAVPVDTATAVLLKSARRCALCFHLKGELDETIGQIAHLDKDPSNSEEDNLAFLCLPHHTLFDSKASQHKNYTTHEVRSARNKLYEAIAQRRHLGGEGAATVSSWDIRYPGGLADVSILRHGDKHSTRLAIAEDLTLVNRSPHQVSLRAIFLIQYGDTQLAADPISLPIVEWTQLLAAFGIRQKPLVSFPLNLPSRSSVEGHIVFPVRPDGAGRGIAGDVPDKRHYSFEFEDLLTNEKRTVSASAVYALDKNNHQRCSHTDFALPGPQEELPVGWQRLNYQRTLEAGGRELYDDLILANFISHSASAPCTMREVVEQIAQHSRKPIPIESLADCLIRPMLSRGKTLFGCPGSCLDQVVGNYENLEWWISKKGLNITIGGPPSMPKQPDAQSPTARKLSVFLCHASADKTQVRELYQRLDQAGFRPWLDTEDILPGQEWQLEIPKAVHAADVVLICLSALAINKEGYVQKEIRIALDAADEKPEGTIFLIPIKLEECDVPGRLSRWQWVHYTPDGYERLLRALRRRAAALGLLTPPPVSAGPNADVALEPGVGKTYVGRVTRMVDFGASVEILPDVTGLLHVSEVSDPRPKKIADVLRLNDQILVKVLKIEGNNVTLSRTAVMKDKTRLK
jgi:hypothetical protein